ncbi:MAG: hypothetical protein LRY51_00480, partial [Geovibrio sp.]|nr:hypothetical protein [Geovibrio sp.]
ALINEEDPCGIKGVCRLENGKLISKGRAEAVHLDDYPPFPVTADQVQLHRDNQRLSRGMQILSNQLYSGRALSSQIT